MAFAHAFARNVTEVVLYAVRVHPTGAAVAAEKVLLPADILNRTS
jgi:hypothetical protein